MSVLTTPFKATGTTLGYRTSLTGTGAYISLAMLVNFDEGGRSIAAIDTTTLASTVKSAIPSIPDNGEITLTVFDVPGDAGCVELRTLAATPVVASWQIQYPDATTGSTDVFSGFLTSLAPKGFAVDGTPTMDVTVKITGAITFTAGS